GALGSAFSAGAVLGALAYGRWGFAWPRRRVYLTANAALAGLFLTIALAPNLPTALAAFALAGLIAGPDGPMIPTLLAQRTPRALRAQVNAASGALTLAPAAPSALLTGLATTHLGLQATNLLAAALYALTLLAVARDRGLKEADGEAVGEG
ncbi:MAG TPA: MFS transporter, partial [Deinococcales bacterium]|nr:MFS transporter [Deinococcales bacterium]